MSKDEADLKDAEGNAISKEEMRQRVSVIADGIMLVRDLAAPSDETWPFMADYAQEVAKDWGPYVMILDLSEGRVRPKGAYKESIKHTLDHVLTLKHLAFVQPSSPLLRTVLRFIASAYIECGSSVHTTLEEAISAAREAAEA